MEPDFDDSIQGVHCILDQGKSVDVQVLDKLVGAVREKMDTDGEAAERLRQRLLELFERMTSINSFVYQCNPVIWRLYADVTTNRLQRAQRLSKAFSYHMTFSTRRWTDNPTFCKSIIDLTLVMLEDSLKARQEAEDRDKKQADGQLSSARQSGETVLRRASEKLSWTTHFIIIESVEKLKIKFDEVTNYMNSNM